MEIRSSLKKIDSYLKIVSDLNKAILDEGTMAPEELQIMKKYLYVCAERIEDIQIKFGLATTETKKGILDNLKQNEEEAEVTLTEFAEVESVGNQKNEEFDILKEIEQSEESSLNVFESFVEANNNELNFVEAKHDVVENISTEQNIISEERILVEPVVFLSADLPSIRYNTLIDFDEYHQHIFDEKPEVKSAVNTMGEIQNNSNVLVADDVEVEKDKIEFNLNTKIKEPINLVSEEKEETQILDDSKRTLVAENIEKVEEKIEFNLNTEIKEPIQLVSEEQVIKPNISTEIEEKQILVLDEIEKDKILVDFEKKSESEETKEHVNLVDTNPEQNDIANEGSTFTRGLEYESIVNRKSLSEQIALNDKFIFVRELFASQFSEYESSIKEIDVFENYQDALDFCTNVLSVKYNWEAKKNISERFLNILNKKYNL